MRLSEFWTAMGDEFGSPYARSLVRDLVLTDLGGVTAEQAIANGRSPREIWLALCKANDVPADRWYGMQSIRQQ